MLQHITNEHNAFKLWKKLSDMYKRKNAMSKASLMRKLVKLEYKDYRSMVVHLNDFQGLINQLSAMSMSPDDELHALLLLSCLPESWDTLVVSLSNSTPEGIMSMDMVKATLLNEEARRKDLSGFNHSEANVVLDSSTGRAKNEDFSCHNRDMSKGISKSKFKVKFICHYCNNPRHIEKFYRKKKRDKSQERKEKMETSTSRQQQQSNGKATLILGVTSDDV